MRVLGFVYMGIFALSAVNFLTKGIKLIPSPEEARSRVVRSPQTAAARPTPPKQTHRATFQRPDRVILRSAAGCA